jgi:hypothetical protein
MDVLQLLRSRGMVFSSTVISSEVARRGHLHVLKWIREWGCSWDAWTCAKAAEGGHFDLLQWARERMVVSGMRGLVRPQQQVDI